ncbi:MAG: hypothetical protein ACJAVY_001080 [Marinoscillum sp.]|jgi:hypothetical protein
MVVKTQLHHLPSSQPLLSALDLRQVEKSNLITLDTYQSNEILVTPNFQHLRSKRSALPISSAITPKYISP